MKILNQILDSISCKVLQGASDIIVEGLTLDSRAVRSNFAFIAIKGSVSDGHKYIPDAISKGASVIIGSVFTSFEEGVVYVEVPESRSVAIDLAANFYDHPASKLKLTGVTGTNGKTSLVYLCHQVAGLLGFRAGLLSTIENRVGGEVLSSTLTTPDPVSFQAMLARMVHAGCTHAFMEVSSHALDQQRVSPSMFDVGVFTNITHDHLDYHGTFDHYMAAKKLLFDGLPEQADALVNIDDKRGPVMLQNCKAPSYTFGLYKAADFKGRILENSTTGLHLLINQKEIFSPLIGAFNASNLVAAFGVSMLLFDDEQSILQALSSVKPPPGRFETFHDVNRRITAIVDYAHTPDALKNVLQTVMAIRKGKEEILTVVGCGGDRDKTKRPVMAKVACQYSDRVILTSDNPRSEDPFAILTDMETGVPDEKKHIVLRIESRAEAIKAACLMAPSNALILIAGKGHENYQEIKGRRIHFDDREQIKTCLQTN